jgi:hypothetical protein
MLYDRGDSVMSTTTSRFSITDFSEIHIYIIGDYDDISWQNFIKSGTGRDTLS